MDFSKLKLELYDIMGIFLPGLLAVSEVWIVVRGWTGFVGSANKMSGTGFTLFVIFSFGAGHLVQESGDFFIKACKGDRFFRRARDKFWASGEADPVKAAISNELNTQIASVDTAFDYCLARIKDSFLKRESFVATSDLCRSLALLSVAAIIPVTRTVWNHGFSRYHNVLNIGICAVFLAFLTFLAWRRMMRFRELSEVTVFNAFLATVSQTNEEDT